MSYRLSLVSLTLMLLALPAAAQTAAGTVAVTVRDASGAEVPGVTIRIVAIGSGAAVEGVTDASGRFESEPLAAGGYTVASVLDGFEPATRSTVVTGAGLTTIAFTLEVSHLSESVVVTARRVEEVVQEVPLPVSVVSGRLVADAGAFNVNRLKELIPTVQFYSTNPRNSAINIRGLGSPFGLTNDGIEPGVGMYIDGVFFARPAAATLDFLDVERVEVLRGPQGTLFGKNTTAGAISVTTRKPTTTPEGDVELTYGSLALSQLKASVAGPLRPSLTGRVSLSGTTRQGTIANTVTGVDLNGLNNLGLRGQLLFTPTSTTAVTLAADHTRQRPDGYAQVVAGVAPTLRPAARQYAGIAADLGYTAPSLDAFDRVTDTDTAWRSHQDLGGASLTIDRDLTRGRLTSITSWRSWTWRPSNDRDFIGLPITTISANPSDQRQWTQEVRYAGTIAPTVNLVAGAFAFRQTIVSSGAQEQGSAAARFLLAPSALAATPGLLDGYGQTSDIRSTAASAALFGQLEWSVTDRLRVLPGLRLNHDWKSVDYRTAIYGGLQTTDAALIALQRSVLAPQQYDADVADTNLSGQATIAYRVASRVHAYGTYATSFKSVGLNLAGVPTDAAGAPVLAAATVKPEDERHIEIGLKTEPLPGVTANLTAFHTAIEDYQAQVVNASVGVLRGYLANADEVRVRGLEFESTARAGQHLSLYGSAAWTDGIYVSFPDAPPPLEETGGPQVKDISGSRLPGISRWAISGGGEATVTPHLLGHDGQWFGAVDASYRSWFSSSASASRYLVVDGYAVVNARVGVRWSNGMSLMVWARNALDTDYFELLAPAPGGSGLFVGLPADPRTVGVTLRVSLRHRP